MREWLHYTVGTIVALAIATMVGFYIRRVVRILRDDCMVCGGHYWSEPDVATGEPEQCQFCGHRQALFSGRDLHEL